MRQLAAATHARFLVPAIAAAVVGLGCQAGIADAKTFTATDTASLVTAVQDANSTSGANTIVLAGVTYAPKSLLELTNTTGAITIEGPTPIANEVGDEAEIIGSAIKPTFGTIIEIDANVTVNLDNVDISTGGGATTPAVDDFGTVDTEGLTTQGNNGAFTIEAGGTGNLVNSTFIGNNSVGVQDENTATLMNDTITQNGEGGIDDSSANALSLVNTVVADNNSADGDCFGPATSSVNSLDSDGTCSVGALSAKNPELQTNPSLDNGGSTPTDAPETGSPLIGAAKASDCPPTDQRGFTRPASCDIGAVQTAKVTPTFNTAAVTAQTSDPTGTTVTYTPTWVDASSPVASTCTPSQSNPGFGPQEAPFPVGTTPVKCTGLDAFGGKGSGQFNVTVTLTGTTTTTTTTTSSHTTTTSRTTTSTPSTTTTTHTTTSTPATTTSTHTTSSTSTPPATTTTTTPSTTTTTPSTSTTSTTSSSSVGPAQSTTTTSSSAVASTAGSTSSSPPATTSSSTSSTQSVNTGPPFVGPVAITAQELIGSLTPGLVPGGKDSTIAELLKHGGISITLHTKEGGVVTIDWYSGKTGAIVAKAKKPKVTAVLVAAGSATAGRAGTVTVKLTLTSAGRKLLKHASTVKLIGEAGFKPSGAARVSTSKSFELHSTRTASAASAAPLPLDAAVSSRAEAVAGLFGTT